MSDPWSQLRKLTTARIALGRSGGSLPTRELLDFRLAHARARDAVHAPFDTADFASQIRFLNTDILCLESAASTQMDFLRRPDLGRRLSHSSRSQLTAHAPKNVNPCDLAIIISDGLSSRAAIEHGPALLSALVPLLKDSGWTLSPLIVVKHGRVALQDEIGELLQAHLSLMLLGERPGLGAADSLGAYFTHSPHTGLTDAARNCVSNIRTEGLSPIDAANKLFHLLTQSRQRGLSGIELKDETPALPAQPNASGLQNSPTREI